LLEKLFKWWCMTWTYVIGIEPCIILVFMDSHDICNIYIFIVNFRVPVNLEKYLSCAGISILNFHSCFQSLKIYAYWYHYYSCVSNTYYNGSCKIYFVMQICRLAVSMYIAERNFHNCEYIHITYYIVWHDKWLFCLK